MLKSVQSFDLRGWLEATKIKPAKMLLGLGGILVIAYLVVGASYIKERQQQSGIKEQVANGGGTLSGVGDSGQAVKGLQDQLSEVKAQTETLAKAFPTKLDSATIVLALLQNANQNHLSIKQMSALPATELKTGGKDDSSVYGVLKYTLVLDGGLPDMLVFLATIEGGATQTAAIDQMTIADAGATKEMTVGVSFYSRSVPSTTATPGTTPVPEATAAAKSN
jgi:Tfp pilus assembly protein PilO